MSALDHYRARLTAALAARDRQGLLRRLERPAGLDLASNDYLGYARDPQLAAAVAGAVAGTGTGSGASRLLHGNSALHEETEARLAAFSGRESALLFTSGYAANVGTIPALAGPGDTIFSDSLNHASIIDGIRLSGADKIVFPHGDLDALEAALAAGRSRGNALIVTESIFSMDGDLCDLEAVCALAERHGAVVMVDEAHATGLYGARGSGRVEELGLTERVLCTMHGGGKALGMGGGWIAGERVLIEHLVNHARSFIYSTGVAPALAAGLRAALDRRQGDGERVTALHHKAAAFRGALRSSGLELGGSASAIVPVVLGEAADTIAVSAALRAEGYDIRAIRPPTVPEGSSRLRITVRAPIAAAVFEALAARIAELAAEVAP